MGAPFFNSEHVRQKLHNTVCMYKGKPVYLTFHANNNFMAYDLRNTNNNPMLVDYTDKELDYSTIELGYMTQNGKAYYLTRTPARINAQGLSGRAIMSEPKYPGAINNAILTKDFYQCVVGSHSTFSSAIDTLLNSEQESISIHRHIALAKISRGVIMAMYRGRGVALSTDRGKTFAIIDSVKSDLIRKRLDKVSIPLA